MYSYYFCIAFTRRDAAAESDRITSSAGDVIDEHRPSIVLFFFSIEFIGSNSSALPFARRAECI